MRFHRLCLLVCILTPQWVYVLSSNDLHYAFWADYNQFNHQLPTAQTWYQKLISKENQPSYTYKGFLYLLTKTGNSKQLLNLIPTIDAAFINDVEIQLLFAQVLQQAGKQDDADIKFINLLKLAKDNPQVVFATVQLFIRKKEPENALSTIHDYLSQATGNPNNFIFHFLAAQIHLSLNKREEALKHIELCLDLNPGFDKGWLIYALINEQSGAFINAIKGYTIYMQINKGSSTQLQEHLMRLTFKQQLLESQQHLFAHYQSPFNQALQKFQQQDYAQALTSIDTYLTTHPQDTDAKLFKIQTLNAMHLIDQAIDVTLSWFKEEPHQELWLELLHVIALEHKRELHIIGLLQELQLTQPKQLYLALYLADLTTRTGAVIEAVSQHYQALKLTNDTTLQAKILCHLASIYYSYKMFNHMPELIKQAESIDHTYTPLLNVVAYWYTTKGNNITKAEHIITTALTHTPDNPFVLDTIGKLYYKQNKFKEAALLFTQSLHHAPGEPTILKHLTKCYIKQQRQYLIPYFIAQALQVDKQIKINV